MVNPPAPMVVSLSRTILEHEIGKREAPDEIAAAIERCFQRLYAELVNLVGHAGYQALLARAVHLTRPEGGPLEVAIADGTVNVKDLAERVKRDGGPRVIDDTTTLLANLIGLLTTFLGEELTMRLVRRIWTEVPHGHSGSGFKEDT